ncbi:MAG: hypothetical protein P1Q69_14385 [Candidatus Thorarchaeota archaeon]|nr:hypothetical protein [Candidatus Thorarchaeota archaeon]
MIRNGSVTNNSSPKYLVRNRTSEWKTYYDFMTEVCSGNWEWSYGSAGIASKDARNREAKSRRIQPHSEEILTFVFHTDEGLYFEGSPKIGVSKSFLVIRIEERDLRSDAVLSSPHYLEFPSRE